MRPFRSTGSSRRLALLFLAVVVPPALALVWLGLQLLEQDRSLLAQREGELLVAAADDAVRSLEGTLAGLEQNAGDLPAGIVRLTLVDDHLEVTPSAAALWVPVAPATEPAATAPFEDAERQWEYRGQAGRALRHYESLTRATPADVRAGAWLRVARVHRVERRWDEALAAYRELARFDAIAFDGQPADLVARKAECTVLDAAGRTEDFAQAADALAVDLLAGTWSLDRPAWELTTQQIEQWTGRPLAIDPDALAMSNAAAWLWAERQREMSGPTARSLRDGVTLLPATPTEIIAVPPSVLAALLASAPGGERLAALDADGRVLAGTTPLGAGSVIRTALQTELPWSLTLAPGSGVPEELVTRRRLLLSGLVAIVLFLAGGSYLLWRVIRSELAVARAQTEFVAAVSHEFRTPLASLRHVTELMQEDDEIAPDRRRSFYQSLGRNTARLQRLVESLLSFGRIEAGTHAWRFEEMPVHDFVEYVVEEARHDRAAEGREIRLDADRALPSVRADREVLASALWNLVENALKYSPPGAPVVVSARAGEAGVEIAVEDQGPGIPAVEQQRIFQKFVRGADAVRGNARGVGIGLALVKTIAEGHGGTVTLRSAPGEGSTFTIILPSMTVEATADRASMELDGSESRG